MAAGSLSSRCGVGSARSRRGFLSYRMIGALTVVGAVAIGGLMMMSSGGRADDNRPDIHVVSLEDFEVTATASGELRAKNQTTLRSRLEQNASIVEIVEEGSLVKKGDLLVRLNSDEIQRDLDDESIQLESAKADVVAAESALQIQLTESSASERKARIEVELAEVELKKFEAGDVVEKRLELDLAVEKGKREVKRLSEKVERSRELFARDFLSKDEMERDEIEYVEALAELRKADVAKAAYEEYTYHKERKKLESDLDQARAELEKTLRRNESELASKEADLTNKRRRLELHEAMVAKYKDQIIKSEIRAPTDGLVVYATSLEQFSWMNNEQSLNVGTQIHPNQEIIMLPDTSEMVAAVKVHESLVGRVRPGQRALVTVDAAMGRKFAGTVESIGIMARSGGWRDPNVREYEVRIALDPVPAGHGLKPSMRCEARVTLSAVDDVLAVPLPAVFTDGPNQFVYIVQGDRYRQTQVKVGRRSDTTAEITSGVKAGERVAMREPPSARVIKTKFERPAAAGAGPGSGAAPAARPEGPMQRGDGEGSRRRGAPPVVPEPEKAVGSSASDDDDDGDDAENATDAEEEDSGEDGDAAPANGGADGG